MLRLRFLLLLLLVSSGWSVTSTIGYRAYASSFPLLVAIPSSYSSPSLVITLHGAGEVGNGSYDGTLIYSSTNQVALTLVHGALQCVNNGVTWFADNNTIVAAPQCASSFAMSTLDNTISALIAEFHVNTARVCLTGLSLGGGAAWNYGEVHPSRLYSLAPVAGASFPPASPLTMFTMKVWAFHDSNDGTVPVAWDTGTLFPAQPLTTAWLYQITGVSCIDNHPQSPTWFTHAVAPQLTNGIVTATYTAGWNGAAWSWVAGQTAPTTGNPSFTLYAGGGHGGWDLTYGTGPSNFNTPFWVWFLGITAPLVTSGVLMPIDQ